DLKESRDSFNTIVVIAYCLLSENMQEAVVAGAVVKDETMHQLQKRLGRSEREVVLKQTPLEGVGDLHEVIPAFRCAQCGEKEVLGRCRGCYTLRYCSHECHDAHWEEQHQDVCPYYKALKRETKQFLIHQRQLQNETTEEEEDTAVSGGLEAEIEETSQTDVSVAGDANGAGAASEAVSQDAEITDNTGDDAGDSTDDRIGPAVTKEIGVNSEETSKPGSLPTTNTDTVSDESTDAKDKNASLHAECLADRHICSRNKADGSYTIYQDETHCGAHELLSKPCPMTEVPLDRNSCRICCLCRRACHPQCVMTLHEDRALRVCICCVWSYKLTTTSKGHAKARKKLNVERLKERSRGKVSLMLKPAKNFDELMEDLKKLDGLEISVEEWSTK
ncbi:MAG: hypothetical protein SGILL_010817, partial [Bacillariaceae sp.]